MSLFDALFRFLAALLLFGGPVPAQGAAGEPLPLELRAVVAPFAEDGVARLALTVTPRGPLPDDLQLRLGIDCGGETISLTEHRPDPPAARWRADEPQRLTLEVPLSLAEVEGGDALFLRLGFAAGPGAPGRPPLDHLASEDGLGELPGIHVMPAFGGGDGEARLAELLAKGAALGASGAVAEAWEVLEGAYLDAVDDPTKARVLGALEDAARLRPPAPTDYEEAVVARRIAQEKTRYFRIVAGRLHSRGQLHGALRLLEAAGGALEEGGGEAVLGDLSEAERVSVSIADLRERLLERISAADTALVEASVKELGRNRALFERAEELAAEGRFPPALAMLRKIRRVDGSDLFREAKEKLVDLGDLWLAATPPEEERAVQEAIEHPAWERIGVRASHRFLFLGPRRLVEDIPDESWRRFDLAYVALTDLFDHRPNPDGDRITVFFKELFDFGGGIGGGKIIDIGRADPDPPRPTRVDNGLLYHELTHCIENMSPDFAGFSEGLANLGAAYCFELLGQKADAPHSFRRNLEEFRTYFVERDLEYWRIQNYGPSAGFFLHFVDTYARRGKVHDWAPLRRFFREYREAPVHDGREPQVVRGLALYLMRAFGAEVFGDLMEFGFPLEAADEFLLPVEFEAFELDTVDAFTGEFETFPSSPLPRDLLVKAHRSDLRHSERGGNWRRVAGVLDAWKTVGPFFAQRANPGSFVFRPETYLDFADKPRSLRASRADTTQLIWQDPVPSWVRKSGHQSVRMEPSGWVDFDYQPYGDDNSAIYALTHVTLPEAADALLHLRGDDEVIAFVDHRRLGAYEGRGRNGSSGFVGWRGPNLVVPDAMVFPVRLEAGRHPILLKIRNRSGGAGFIAALSRKDGSRLDFTADNGPPESPGPRPEVSEPKWKRVASLDHRSFKSRGKIEVGSFRSRNKAFHGVSDDRGVGWRRFTVRPGFPKDSPSNLLWLKPKLTEDLEAVKIDLALVPGRVAPKLVLTFQGEGGEDGLSGWNLILVPHGGRRMSARLERYDRLIYETDPAEMPFKDEGGDDLLELSYHDGWCTVRLGGTLLFDRVPIRPIPGRHRVGLATWGPETEIRTLELFEAR